MVIISSQSNFSGEKVSVIAKTTVVDTGTTSELGFGERRHAHVLVMYGTILFWVSSAMLVFCYTGADKSNSELGQCFGMLEQS